MKQLDFKDKIDLAEEIANLWTERADLKELMIYYYNAQYEYLSDLSDEELLTMAKDEGIKL